MSLSDTAARPRIFRVVGIVVTVDLEWFVAHVHRSDVCEGDRAPVGGPGVAKVEILAK